MKKHLGLFFTRGVSLGTWAQVGNLTRELAIYKRLVERGYEVSFVTYGDSSDLDFVQSLEGIKVICNDKGLSPEEYETGMIHIHKGRFREFTVIKTNQIFGADIALNVAKTFSKPFIARCGYLWSYNAAKEYGADSAEAQQADRIERLAFSEADAISVTTQAMKMNVAVRLPDCESRISIIPNYVDTDLFKPMGCDRVSNQILFIGRIAPEKNLLSLFEAIRPLDVRLVIIGDGPQRKELESGFPDLKNKVSWLGNIPNMELPFHINRSAIYILPSLYEGHPKALIEAMACAVPVIGCNSPGIREIIRPLESGLLSEPDPQSLRSAIEHLITNQKLAQKLGNQAREFILESYSLDNVIKLEMQILPKATML